MDDVGAQDMVFGLVVKPTIKFYFLDKHSYQTRINSIRKFNQFHRNKLLCKYLKLN
jgi:hypothetical protein